MQLADNNEFMRSVSARVDLLTTKLGIATLGDYKQTVTTDDSIVVLPEEGKSIFQSAMADRGKGEYEFAVAGFTEFLTKYPDSELSDDELAWLDKNEESALAYYVRLLDQFPDSELRADTLLKTFSMLTESGNSEAAGRYLQQLEDEFPDSEQVGLAKASVN